MSTDRTKESAELIHEIREKNRKALAAVEAVNLNALVTSGQLTPLGASWYEIRGSVQDLPEGVAFLTEQVRVGKSPGRTKIKLGDREKILKGLRALEPATQ